MGLPNVAGLIGCLPPGDVRDALKDYEINFLFSSSFVQTLPTPFRCPAALGNLAITQATSAFTDALCVCYYCARALHLIRRVGYNLMYSCVTCANANGDPIGIASAARIRRIHYEEPPEPARGRVQLCFPTPEAMRVTTMSHTDNELAAIVLRTLVTTPKTDDREWMPIYEFLADPNHFDLGFPGMFDTDLEWLTT